MTTGFLLGCLRYFWKMGWARTMRYKSRTDSSAMQAVPRNEGDLYFARDLATASATWHLKNNDPVKAARMTASTAELWVKEAVARAAGENPSNMIAASFYENAIQTYRSIPRKHRSAHNGDERVAQLLNAMNEVGEKSVDELAAIRSDPIDLTEIATHAQNVVRCENAVDALRAFADLYDGADVESLRKSAEDSLRAHPLQTLLLRRICRATGASLQGGQPWVWVVLTRKAIEAFCGRRWSSSTA